jgi:GT2 family glycosyltransferase
VKIHIVCATRLSADRFHAEAALGRSLALYPFPFVSLRLFSNNSIALPTVYNAALRELRQDPALVVFIHDDVHLMDIYWPDRVAQGLAAFDIIGVAGNTRRLPRQPSWRFIDDQWTFDEAQYLSGAIAHGSGWPARHVSYYGTIGREVKLLDGVLLAARSDILLSRNMLFDERFAFHLYDLDFCRQAERQRLRMGTWPIPIVHESGGSYGGPTWTEAYARYLEKWES